MSGLEKKKKEKRRATRNKKSPLFCFSPQLCHFRTYEIVYHDFAMEEITTKPTIAVVMMDYPYCAVYLIIDTAKLQTRAAFNPFFAHDNRPTWIRG